MFLDTLPPFSLLQKLLGLMALEEEAEEHGTELEPSIKLRQRMGQDEICGSIGADLDSGGPEASIQGLAL